jgi:hypothetical protein
MEVPLLPSIGPSRGTYFGRLLELLLKRANVDECKPSSFQARLRFFLSISPQQYIEIAYYKIVYYMEVAALPSIGTRGAYFGKLLEILLKRAKVDT